MKKSIVAATLLVMYCYARAASPTVNTVDWVPSNPLIPHDSWSGKAITLKGTSDSQGANFEYSWDFGDGSPSAVGTVSDQYNIQATHAYSAPVGTVFTARLTVENTSTGETGSDNYYVVIQNKTLPVEVNVAIDEGLWYLHRVQSRSTSGGLDYGTWKYSNGPGYHGSYHSITAQNLNAFQVNGYTATGPATHPYTETVQRGMNTLFAFLGTTVISPQPLGNPDSDGNGYGVYVNGSRRFYEGGIVIDAIVASGTPGAKAPTGPLASGGNPGIFGRTYKEIVQDMVDYYAYGQYDGSNPVLGGWRYSANQYPDNSACQWAAIGIIAAERNWGCTLPAWVKTANIAWLNYSQAASGVFGYTSASPIWGPYATTPSGMVQMAMDGIGRGNTMWDASERFMRDNFDNPLSSGATGTVKRHQYGLFSFVKAMLLHDSNGDGISEPIQFLKSSTPGKPPIDWYSAEAASGDTSDGVARTLVNDQYSGGHWWGKNYYGLQFPYETAQSIIMLKRTLFESGAPVAVAKAIPNPAVAGQTVYLDGSDTFHQDPSKNIVSYEWDLDNDGIFESIGPFQSQTFGAVGDYPIKLRVTDDGTPILTAETTVSVRVTTPPVAPSADAGGPYVFCPGPKWFLEGNGSTNPDEGQSEPFQPGDTIQTYAWELNGDNSFDDAFGPAPDVTAFYSGLGAGDYIAQLRVTDTTSTSFPSSGFSDLSSTDSATVHVRDLASADCDCVDDLMGRPKVTLVQLVWAHVGAHHYNVYRSSVAGGPYLLIGNTDSTYSTYVDEAVVLNQTYHYVVRPADALNREACESNEASVTVRGRTRR